MYGEYVYYDNTFIATFRWYYLLFDFSMQGITEIY